jgi:hypothetical protein
VTISDRWMLHTQIGIFKEPAWRNWRISKVEDLPEWLNSHDLRTYIRDRAAAEVRLRDLVQD